MKISRSEILLPKLEGEECNGDARIGFGNLVCHHISNPSYGVCLATPWRLIVRSKQMVLCWPHAIVVVITMGWSRFFTFLSGLKWLALCGHASVRCFGYLIGSTLLYKLCLYVCPLSVSHYNMALSVWVWRRIYFETSGLLGVVLLLRVQLCTLDRFASRSYIVFRA